MDPIKQSRNDTVSPNDDNNKDHIDVTKDETNRVFRRTISHFEDLANELIYEIFEFLDFYHIYEAFFNLNRRFHNLLVNSIRSIKINISSMSKSAFQRYHADVILPNKHRIQSIHLSNVFCFDPIYSSFLNVSECFRLDTLILNHIEAKYLENLLNQLLSLPFLSSLVIICIDYNKNNFNIYRQIFRLSALKYCKLSLNKTDISNSLPVANDECSTIEHLIINDKFSLCELYNLLSYVPRLRRLSIHLISIFVPLILSQEKKKETCSITLNDLTHVSLSLNQITFTEFEHLIKDLFHSVRGLRISIDDSYENREYISAYRWQHMILLYMTNLRTFDIQCEGYPYDRNAQLTLESQLEKFKDLFWIERKWFFAHQHYRKALWDCIHFYSTNPYRGKDFFLGKQSDKKIYLGPEETNLSSVRHIHIRNEEGLRNCMKYFSNVTMLSLDDGFVMSHNSISITLNRIIPLKQLTKLIIGCYHFSFREMLELLSFIPNIHTLTLKTMPADENDYRSIKQSGTFKVISDTNIITNLILDDMCTLDKIHLLVALCPRVKRLSNYYTR